jgi:hypothetical protein
MPFNNSPGDTLGDLVWPAVTGDSRVSGAGGPGLQIHEEVDDLLDRIDLELVLNDIALEELFRPPPIEMTVTEVTTVELTRRSFGRSRVTVSVVTVVTSPLVISISADSFTQDYLFRGRMLGASCRSHQLPVYMFA